MTEGIEVRRASSRRTTDGDGTSSAHAFSFGYHYDSTNTSHGPLVAFNDELVRAGAGFAPHPHRGLEIVTWVLSGTLTHEDSSGARGVVVRGQVQRLNAGTGVVHSERNDDAGAPLRFLQSWLAVDEPNAVPSYEVGAPDPRCLAGGLVPVASGTQRRPAAVRLANRGATLHVGRLDPGQTVRLPEAPWLHLHVAIGAVSLQSAGPLAAGDAVRLTATGGQGVTALEPAELLVWELHARPH